MVSHYIGLHLGGLLDPAEVGRCLYPGVSYIHEVDMVQICKRSLVICVQGCLNSHLLVSYHGWHSQVRSHLWIDHCGLPIILTYIAGVYLSQVPNGVVKPRSNLLTSYLDLASCITT